MAAEKDNVDVQNKIHQAFSMLLFFTIPLTMGISFLSKPIWNLFYGNSIYGANVLSYFIFVGFFIGFFTSMIIILQTLKDNKSVLISLVVGVLFKMLLNMNLMKAFYQMGLPPYYGFITASIIGYFISSIICIIVLNRKYGILFEDMVRDFIDIMIATIIMVFCLFIIKYIIPIYSTSRIINLFIVLFYGVIGMVIYFSYGKVSGLTKRVLGRDFYRTLKRIIIHK